MTMPVAEPGTSKLEQAIESVSDEKPEVSDTTEEEVEEKPEEEKPEAKKEAEVKADDKDIEKWKADPRIKAWAQSEKDKQTNSYRETREADKAYIGRLTEQLKEAQKQGTVKKVSGLLAQLESEGEAEGLTEKQIKPLREALKEFAENYDNNFAPVREAAEFISSMTAKMPQAIVKEFGLDDPNPAIRASNGSKFLDETVAVYKHNQNFLVAVEQFLPNGEEVREQLDELVEGMAEFEGNDKAKKLYIADKMKGLKVTPKRKPATPSGTPGGRPNKLRGDDALKAGLEEERKKYGFN